MNKVYEDGNHYRWEKSGGGWMLQFRYRYRKWWIYNGENPEYVPVSNPGSNFPTSRVFYDEAINDITRFIRKQKLLKLLSK